MFTEAEPLNVLRIKMNTPEQASADPVLAISNDEPIGRLYHKPGVTVPETLNKKELQELVHNGTLVPSTTNVIGVKSSPYLLPWATRKVADSVVQLIRTNASSFVTRVKENSPGAVDYLSKAADRERDAWGNQGSNIHLACELLGKNQTIDHLNLTPYERQSVDQWKAWLDKFQPVFKYLETTGFGSTRNGLGYAHTTDFIAEIEKDTVIGDYKCVTDNTPILLPDGNSKPAIDIKQGDEVVAWDKISGLHTAKVLYAGDNGHHKIVRVTTFSGHTLETTTNHPYWASRKSQQLNWVQAEDLKLGDEVYIAVGWNYSPYRQQLNWPFNKYFSPYAFGLLWALRNFLNVNISDTDTLELPPISGEGLAQELKEMSFQFTKDGRVKMKRGLNKIADKNNIPLDELLGYINTPVLPDFLYGASAISYSAFFTGVMEVFANRELSNEELIVVMNGEALTSLQALYSNYGQPATIVKDPRSGHVFLKAPFETKDTIFTHGVSATRIASIDIIEEPQHTVALEVAGAHTHITGGIVTHNTNRSGLHAEVALQLAANSRGETLSPDNENLIPMPKIDYALGVHLAPHQATTAHINIGDDVFEVFESLRNVWEFSAFSTVNGKSVFAKPIVKKSDLPTVN